MTRPSARRPRWNAGAAWRIGCTLLLIILVEAIVCGAAALPVVLFWIELAAWTTAHPGARVVAFSVALIPSYIAFALCLMAVSALATWVTGARTPHDAELRLENMEWPLMRWARYMVASHIVRALAGALFRGSPVWTIYLRLNGARIGRRVYVNTLSISDHNLLELGDDVVIGSDVHVSGHTVEGGVLKTRRVRLSQGVTIGLGTVVDIDVVVGAGCQVGALSLVPKHTTLAPDAVYAGIPVRRIDRGVPAST